MTSIEPSHSCARCAAALTPGARFCHRCGAPTGAAAPADPADPAAAPVADRSGRDIMPWAVAGIALLALFALVAGRGFTGPRGSEPGAPPQPGLDLRAGAPMRASDIWQLSPEERADRLYNRVMLLASQGQRDSVQFFAPMAIQAYQMIGPLNEDQHYDVGRIAEIAGAIPLARAHADTILARSPTHLLGLILAARVATVEGNAARRLQYERRLLAAEVGELARGLPEYQRHQDEIAAALATARRSAR